MIWKDWTEKEWKGGKGKKEEWSQWNYIEGTKKERNDMEGIE